MSVETRILGPFEVAAGHGFADPEHVAADRATMTMMLDRFNEVLARHGARNDQVIDYCPDEQRWTRRVMIPRPSVFDSLDNVTVVGFFGGRRHDAHADVCARIDELSAVLFRAIPRVAGVYAYVTQLLVDEYNYANLVLVEDAAVIQRWRETAPHPAAAAAVSPDYYEHIRIYNGAVRVAAVAESGTLDLDCVKYWDFRQTPMWAAVRRYGSAAEAQAS